ncbi:putative membrane protein [Encephalitozoon romaleae SJ-2008]|uniref:GPI-anchored wall transfer protein 1 n=1 Tax=Encephalitozoon romaleae (strain SJ-2008) TaxID=1178016 RepID=I7ARK0_ENCRO|nr:putative membrane protein [Encephalitozoon romaleae SJ-2008]AFN83002.1 putative membrane protein [Encephalitozoon romaleae SJ-2008]
MKNTNELELLQITGMSALSLMVYSSGYRKTMLNDFLFCIVPQYCAIMFPNEIWILYLCLVILAKYPKIRRSKETTNEKTSVIDHLRFTISALVVIAIYGVDFTMFDKRLGKSHFLGISLMDIGVGSFIYNSGVVRCKSRFKRKHVKSYLILILLGFVRFFVVKWFNISVNPKEYGTHLNFYFLLAIVNFICSMVKSRYNFLLGLLVITVYEGVLRFSRLMFFIFSDERRTFLEKNKEGLTAIISYVSIFLMATEVGRICLSQGKIRRKALRVLGMSGIFACLYVTSCFSCEGSRRLGNAAFVFWILALHTFHVGIYMLLESTIVMYNPLVVMFCSSNMMFIFLFSNLIVLVGNTFFDLKSFSPIAGHLNMLVYLISVFLAPALLASRFDLRWIGLGYRP